MFSCAYTQYEVDVKKYKKIKRINKGGFGIVYLVEEKESGKPFAAKIIDCCDDENQCNKMIEREVSIMMHMKHPTIVKLIGYSKFDFQGENNVTVIMELAQNGSLSDIIKNLQKNNGPTNYSNTSRQIILVGIARGMKYLHDRNIIHRDLKAGNILLDDNLHPHITDFGMSKAFDVGHSYSQSQFGGTIPYTAPEILNNEKYDKKVDVYAFGILMYEVITDSFSYPELESGEISDLCFRFKVVSENYRPKFNIKIKESIKQLIEQCWATDPNKRPTFNEIFHKLAYGEDPKSVNDNGGDYFLESIDTDELKIYVEDITEITDPTEQLLDKIATIENENKELKDENIQLKIEIEQLKKENKMLKNRKFENKASISDSNIKEDLEISEFNELPLKSKHSISEKVSLLYSDRINFLIRRVNDLIIYLEQFSDLTGPCFEIDGTCEERLSDINEERRIYIYHNVTSILFNYNSLNSTDFKNMMNEFGDFCIEIKYPSESFQEIYDCILKIRNSYPDKNKIKMAIFITGISETDQNFHGDKNISYITLDSTITKIKSDEREGSFEGCISLVDISIPSSVTSIEDHAFEGCISLKRISIPSAVNFIGAYAFYCCASLVEITIPYSVKKIEYSTFNECSSLKYVSIPSSVTSIDNYAFRACRAMKKIIIPSSVTTIGSNAFNQCSSLKQISIPSSVTSIGPNAFIECTSLTEIVIPSSVKSIGRNVFESCTSLRQITIPSFLKTNGMGLAENVKVITC